MATYHPPMPVRPSARRGIPGERAATGALAAAAFLFGTTFVVVQDAVERAEPVPFLGVRFAVGALALLPFAIRRGRPARGLVPAGLAAGVALGAGYLLQTVGLQYTSSSASAFITYLLVLFVPLLSAVVLRRPPRPATVAGVAVAIAGLLLLAGDAGAGGGLGRGEALTLACAVAFAAHIVVVAEVAPRFDTVQLTAAQLAVVAVALVPTGMVTGGYDVPAEAWLAAAYTGVAVTALAFVLQVWGQRRVTATRTALVLMLEPVFAAGLGWVAGDRLGAGGAVGAALILGGILLSELQLAAGGRALSLTARSGSREPDASR